MKRTLLSLILLVFVAALPCMGASTIYRPGPKDGVDMWYSSYYPYNGSHFVDDQKLQIGGWGDSYWTLIKFDLGCLPRQATSAVLGLMPYPRNDSSTNVSMNVYLVTSPWTEQGGWSGSLTGYFAGTVPAPSPGTWYTIDLTSIYNAWQAGSYANWGLAFTPTATDNRSNYFRSSDYTGNETERPKLVIQYSPSTTESFRPCTPLRDHTPYSVEVTSLLDHSISSDGFYRGKDNTVKTYNGQIGLSGSNNCQYTSTLAGYRRDNGMSFTLPLINYNDEMTASRKDCAFYDEHSGYDYRARWREDILAATDGTLCVSTNITSPNGSTPWRNSSKCPYGNDPINGTGAFATSWDKWHIFYIMHPGGTYSTWYLHADSLETSVYNSILSNGYADVRRLQVVGSVGNWGLGCSGTSCKHLHFETRSGLNTIVDPYGNGSGGILWGAQTP